MATGPPRTLRLDQDTADRLDELKDDRGLSNDSKAVRVAIDRGLLAMGYDGGMQRPKTTIERYSWDLAKLCVAFAAALLTVGLMASSTIIVGTSAIMGLAAAGSVAIYTLEPGLTQRVVTEWAQRRNRGETR